MNKKIIFGLAGLVGLCVGSAGAADYTLKSGVSNWAVADSYLENAVPPSNSRIIVPSGSTVTLNWKDDSTSRSTFTAQTEITVDGTLVIDGTPASATDALACPNLSGSGIVTNASPSVFILRFTKTGGKVFSGKICGVIQPQVYAGVQHFTGTGSTYSQWTKLRDDDGTVTKGVLGIAKFGKVGEPSSIGTMGIETERGAGMLLYLGSGEDTDKDIRVCGYWSSAKEVCGAVVVDAGAVGGLRFTGGKWAHTPGTGNAVHGIVLTGSNETASVIGNTFESVYGSGHYYPFHITKRGTGVWRMADTVMGHRAGFFVEEGRLQFDSIAEKGITCSLGTSDILTTNYRSGWDDSQLVDYAFTLGAMDSPAFGTMEYLGTTLGKCTTRPFVLAGNGRLTGSSTGTLALSNVRGIGTGARTLALDGSAGSTNHIANVTNGTAVVSVVKEGKGAWSMSGKLDFSGTLTVKDGLLTAYNRAPYTYFRFNGQQTASGGSSVNFTELALYDADGVRRNKGLNVVNIPDPYPASGTYVWHEDETFQLPTDSAGFGRAAKYLYSVYDVAFRDGNLSDMRSLFRDVANGVERPFETIMRTSANVTIAPVANDPSTWLRIVMRLSDETPAITAFDLCRPYWSQVGYDTHFTHFSMEGSVDGLSWEELYATTDPAQPIAGTTDAEKEALGYCWMSDGAKFKANEVRKDKGYAFTKAAKSEDGLTGVTAVSVEKGARLEIVGEPLSVSNLIVSVSGVGTLANVAFAERGVMTVTGSVPRDTADLGGTFENVSGLENLNGWTALCAERPNAKRKIEIVDGKIRLVPLGLCVIVR